MIEIVRDTLVDKLVYFKTNKKRSLLLLQTPKDHKRNRMNKKERERES